ncbi:DNA polymerase epsilon subunit 4 [Aricia agestis]|uniref:DNA polymerase epsilon subunit 4 n=1 Tax=Aricia agestis TaxID=91739 RepID=UPI001C20A897|nr:DNA polymerase epsilon subunit 4 [Aricia agestis]
MTEEENFTEVDVSDVIEDSENLLEGDYNISEATNLPNNTEESEIANTENQLEKKLQSANKNEAIRTTKLPVGRIKNIMKMDPDVHVISAEAVFLVAKATEMFLETIGKETYVFTSQQKRKTIAKKDLDVVINKVDCLCFLEGAMDF